MASLAPGVAAEDELPTRDRLLRAAMSAFTTHGYAGASLRDIERSAGVSRGLVAHHFDTKDALWRGCVDWLMSRFHAELERIHQHLPDVSQHERAKVLLKVYVRFAARHPEYTRLLVLSGDDDSDRVRWMVDKWIRPNLGFYHRMSGSEADRSSAEGLAMKTYAFMGAAAMLFTLPVEARLVFGVDVRDDAFIEQFAEFMVQWVGIDVPTADDQRFDSAVERAADRAAAIITEPPERGLG